VDYVVAFEVVVKEWVDVVFIIFVLFLLKEMVDFVLCCWLLTMMLMGLVG